jgi:hypothetical protein
VKEEANVEIGEIMKHEERKTKKKEAADKENVGLKPMKRKVEKEDENKKIEKVARVEKGLSGGRKQIFGREVRGGKRLQSTVTTNENIKCSLCVGSHHTMTECWINPNGVCFQNLSELVKVQKISPPSKMQMRVKKSVPSNVITLSNKFGCLSDYNPAYRGRKQSHRETHERKKTDTDRNLRCQKKEEKQRNKSEEVGETMYNNTKQRNDDEVKVATQKIGSHRRAHSKPHERK